MPTQPIQIDRNSVDRYRRLNYTWTKIASMMSTSTDTLCRWRKATDYEDPLIIPNDAVLDEFVSKVGGNNDKIGEVTMEGRLIASGLKVTRSRLRNSINRVDPEGRENRKHKKIKRREYKVSGPHALWHIDGHHKLKNWKIATHGCIDGYSRYIVYLNAADNNSSTTVVNLFNQAVHDLGFFPSRVRGDYGGENIQVALRMVENNGVDRGSFICGTSTRNQRIERLWRDYHEQVTSVFVSLFKSFGNDGILNVESNDELFCLHILFIPLLNKKIKEFKDGWNNHKLSTEHSRSPLQILEEKQDITAAYPYNDDGDDLSEGEEVLDEDDIEEREKIEANRVVFDSPKNPFNLNDDEEQGVLFLREITERGYTIGNNDDNETMSDKLHNVIRLMRHLLRGRLLDRFIHQR